MESTELSRYYNKYCRFRLKSGKEVYGVVRESGEDGETVFFSSLADAVRKLPDRNIMMPVRKDEIAGAEPLPL